MRAFICSMHNEHGNVLSSLGSVVKNFTDAFTIVIHSFDKYTPELKEIIAVSDIYVKLSDLSRQYDRYAYPSFAISRNYSIAFQELYGLAKDLKYVVCFTGDTLVTDASNFDRMHDSLRGRVAAVSQSVGQDFHAPDSDPLHGKCGGRFQEEDTTDFACSLFMLDGTFALGSKVFKSIPVTNRYTTEQILGDALASCFMDREDFKKQVMRLNENNPGYSYAYDDGIRYHQHSGKPCLT